jgi:hypothetical protein
VAQGGDDLVAVSVQDAQALGADPALGRGVGFVEQASAAFHTYSRTCTKSIRMVTSTWRAWAWAWVRWIWWVLPSTRTIQRRSW